MTIKRFDNVYFAREDFKKEFSNIEIYGVEAIVNQVFEEEYDLENAVDILGLAYTSSGWAAGLGICNGEFIIEELIQEYEDGDEEQYTAVITVNCFRITNNNMLVAECSDQNDNEYYYEITA